MPMWLHNCKQLYVVVVVIGSSALHGNHNIWQLTMQCFLWPPIEVATGFSSKYIKTKPFGTAATFQIQTRMEVFETLTNLATNNVEDQLLAPVTSKTPSQRVTRCLFLTFETRSRFCFLQSCALRRDRDFFHLISGFETRSKFLST